MSLPPPRPSLPTALALAALLPLASLQFGGEPKNANKFVDGVSEPALTLTNLS